MINNFIKNPRSFYTFANCKRTSTGFPSFMKFINKKSSSVDVICDIFADFFTSTYSNAAYNDANMRPYSLALAQVVYIPTFSDCDILIKSKDLKMYFRPGPDVVPSCILNRCAESFITPLVILFNTDSISYGYFPVFWKDSYIILLFKSDNKSDVTNYRGIAKLSAIPKMFEKLIVDFLVHHTSSLLSPHQHGFRKGCSAATNVLQLTSK